MKASLALNHEGKIALFYDAQLTVTPQWTSIDIEQGEIYIAGIETDHVDMKIDHVDDAVYERIKSASEILLIQIDANTGKSVNHRAVPLMISRKI